MNCTKNGTEHYQAELRPGYFLAQQRRGGDSEPATIVQQKNTKEQQTGQSDFNCKNSRYIHRHICHLLPRQNFVEDINQDPSVQLVAANWP